MNGAFDSRFLILDLRLKSKTADRKSKILSFSSLVFGLLISCVGCSSAKGEVKVREATHADGSWYPSTASELGETIDSYLAKVKGEPTLGRSVALIVPHAGYRFCGQVAACAYKQIEGMNFDTVVLLGPSHHYGFPGASVYESGVYRNPLGDVEVDSAIAKRLMDENDAIKFNPRVHIPEHSIENQIPFLQRTLSKFKIVPILMQDFSKENCDMLSTALANVLKGRNVLLIASSDMSHYPVYDEAVKADKVTISAIETMDPDLTRERLDEYLKKGVRELHCMLCGKGPVLVVMAVAKELGADSVKVLKYANSGDVPIGDKRRVVGYMAAMMYKSEGDARAPSEQKGAAEALDAPINKEQQDVLLEIARESIETYLKTGKKKRSEIHDERLKIEQGAFVTLRKNDMLRGCIGHIIPTEPLQDTVADMAVAAATQDPRFPAVTLGEMKDIHIEISVLSVPRRVQSADEIELGKHGVIVRRGSRQGVFLPQVATETGWDKETFLENLCSHKAFLPKDAWKDKDTELVVFTAQVFEEEGL
jgi:AmmeMemoRadiSam system protein B/AmmeMemoRadiSam system protein A